MHDCSMYALVLLHLRDVGLVSVCSSCEHIIL